MTRLLIGIAIGCTPGVALALWGNIRPGIATMVLGTVVAILYVIGDVSVIRTLKLLWAFLVAKNLPILGERSFDWVDKGHEPDAKKDWLAAWLTPEHLASGTRWKVLAGACCGLLVGVGVVCHDLFLTPPRNPWVLPLEGVKDSLTTQSCLIMVGVAICGAALGGAITSPIYRRILTVAIVSSALVSVCIGYAALQHSRVSLASFVTFFVTAGVALGLLVAWVVDSPAGQEQQDEGAHG